MAIAGLVGAGVAVFLSFVARAFGCEGGGDCVGGTWLLVIACVGVLPIVCMLIDSRRRDGNPWYWFVAAAVVYGLWGVVVTSLAG